MIFLGTIILVFVAIHAAARAAVMSYDGYWEPRDN
jgi:hypothetical protein